ncbi:MAG: hypothetical protein U5K69_00195 [Balneolaceae bacterium]|nr:hypothetical protein [Balneolaceae bacterium]
MAKPGVSVIGIRQHNTPGDFSSSTSSKNIPPLKEVQEDVVPGISMTM